MDCFEVKGWVDVARGTVDLLRSAAAALPNGDEKTVVEAKIPEAENALKRSDAKLARELGLKLCDCTFPPNVMLWKETERAHVCPNEQCGRRKFQSFKISKEAIDELGRPSLDGPNSWMAR